MDASDLYWKPRKNFLRHFSKEKPCVCLYFFPYFTNSHTYIKKKRMPHVLVTSDLRVEWTRAETVKVILRTHRIVNLTQNNMLQVQQRTVSKERRGEP